jgi:hypothetical protein
LGTIQGIYPVIQHTFTNTLQKKQFDNIIFHGPSTTEYTGRCGVLNVMKEYGLNMDQAQEVSDHFPIWAEFNAYESTTPGRVAYRDGQLQMQ